MFKKVIKTSLLGKNPFIKKAGVSLSFFRILLKSMGKKTVLVVTNIVTIIVTILKTVKNKKIKVFTSFKLRNKGVGEGGGLAVATPLLQGKSGRFHDKGRYSQSIPKYALVGKINN